MDDSLIDSLLEKQYWIIDILPTRVPASRGGQYLEAEKFFMEESLKREIFRKFAMLLVKLGCYESLSASPDSENWSIDPPPEILYETVMECCKSGSTLWILLEGGSALLTLSGDDHYMTLYGPSPSLRDLVETLSSREGLFLWKSTS